MPVPVHSSEQVNWISTNLGKRSKLDSWNCPVMWLNSCHLWYSRKLLPSNSYIRCRHRGQVKMKMKAKMNALVLLLFSYHSTLLQWLMMIVGWWWMLALMVRVDQRNLESYDIFLNSVSKHGGFQQPKFRRNGNSDINDYSMPLRFHTGFDFNLRRLPQFSTYKFVDVLVRALVDLRPLQPWLDIYIHIHIHIKGRNNSS